MLLGSELVHFKKNVEVHSPISIVSHVLSFVGNAPHQGGEENGFFGVDLKSGEIGVVIFSQKTLTVYGKSKAFWLQNEPLREWIYTHFAQREGMYPVILN